MNRKVLALGALFLVKLTLLSGCSDECKQLADLSCEKAGEGSEECRQIRVRADKASADDNRICAKALVVANTFVAK